MKSTNDSSGNSLEKALSQKFELFSLDEEIRQIAERLREQTIAELKDNGKICDEKQSLINSLQVVKGARQGEYLLLSDGEYGKDLEFGTRNSPESPWLFPAFNKVTGSIGTCLHGALKRALVKARRLPAHR